MDQVSLLIVEDHPIFVEGFRAMLERARPGWQVRDAPGGAEALLLIEQHQPALVVADIYLPGLDGFTLLAALAARWPELPVVFISARDQASIRFRARACGARGFLPKATPAPQLIEAVEAVLAGGTAFEPGEAPDGGLPVLTPRQGQILDLLALGHGNKEIRHQLGIAERTVRAHLTELFHLLGVHSRMQAIIRARELGLIQ